MKVLTRINSSFLFSNKFTEVLLTNYNTNDKNTNYYYSLYNKFSFELFLKKNDKSKISRQNIRSPIISLYLVQITAVTAAAEIE